MNVLRNRFFWAGLLALFVGFFVMALVEARRLTAATGERDKALEALVAIDAVGQSLTDTAEGQASFLVTSEKSALDRYTEAAAGRAQLLAKLDESVTGESEQQDRLKHLHELVDERVSLAEAVVAQAGRGDRDGAIDAVKRGNPKRVSDAIDAEIKLMRGIERARSEKAQQDRDGVATQLLVWLSLLGVVGIALGGLAFFIVHTDASKHENTDLRLNATEEHFRIVSDLTGDLVRFHDAEDHSTYANAAAADLLAMNPEEVVGLPPRWLLHPEEVGSVLAFREEVSIKGRGTQVHRMRQKAGGFRWFETRTQVMRTAGDARAHYASVSRDLTDKKRLDDLSARHADELQKQTFRDPLTGLYNRRGLAEIAEKFIAFGARTNNITGIVLIGLNGLKAIQDRAGRDASQRILTELGKVIVNSSRTSDVVAHLGNDEFVVLALEVTPESVAGFTARIEAAITELNAKKDRVGDISMNVGAAFSMPEAPVQLGSLLSEAQVQMQHERQLQAHLGI